MLVASFSKWGEIRATSVVVVSCIFLLIATSLGGLVAKAVVALTETANAIDDQRSLDATEGAIRALRKQLAATVRDNAYWDDAYAKMQEADREAWILDNWGSTTENYPLYDTSLVIDPAGKAVGAYHDGKELSEPIAFFDATFEALLAAARKPDARDNLPVSFLETKHGIMMVGAAAIQPYKADPNIDPNTFHILVFGKELKQNVLAEIGQNYSIKGLSFETSPSATLLQVPLQDARGQTVGYFSWPPQHPGSRSFEQVRGYVAAAAAILVLFLGGIVWAGYAIVANVRGQEAAANFKATHDALTGLWNRAGFFDQLEQALASAGSTPIVLHLIDLDGFKVVNDTWGHPVGDELIRAVAARLGNLLPSGAFLARLGGDEFAVFTPASHGSEIVEYLRQPFAIDGRMIEIGGSVGLSLSGEEDLTAAEMVRRADLALYRAKASGRGTTMTFSVDFDSEEAADRALELDLRAALANGGLHVMLQPLIDVPTRDIIGIEALARWHHATRGPVPPDLFIRVAERSGLIDDLGCQILEMAVEAAAAWPNLSLAINMSPVQLRNPNVVKDIANILKAAEFDPSRLTIEVTESVFITNPDQAKRIFAAFQALGVKIALDDFGAGYASVGALREYNFDRMKIDKSLTSQSDGQGVALLQATMALANALGVPVTAEGVETEEQARTLRLFGCSEFQGYLFSKPLLPDEVTERYFSKALAVGS